MDNDTSRPGENNALENHVLGENNVEIMLTTVEENRQAAISLASQARHRINIFTQDLDAELYDNETFEKCIFDLATSHPSSEVRILLQNSTRAIQHSHCLIRLAQRLTSSVSIKKPADRFRDVQHGFLTVDSVGMLYRAQGDHFSYDAILNYMSPQRVSTLDDFFTEVWEHSQPDPQVRRLFV